MKVLDSRFLRGPNIHRTAPCFVALFDLEGYRTLRGDALKGSAEMLRKLMPAASHPVVLDAAEAVRLVARIMFLVQARGGSLLNFYDTLALKAVAPAQYRLLCAYQHEALAEHAFRLAVDCVSAIVKQQVFDVEAQLDTLYSIAHASARAPAATLTVNNDGRIPVVAVTGTNGKTTTTLLISHVLRASGKHTGTTTTEGIFIDGLCVEKGDCSGYWSARRVLLDPVVEIATLETARGGILKRGLAFDYCDVGIVLNVSSDHLGLDGIETLHDLAQVKGLLARCARHAAVLNADDTLCVTMRDSLAANCRAVFFSMDPHNAVLVSHIKSGGAAAFLNAEGWLVWCRGAEYLRVVKATDLPFTLQGHARHNIANALAALGALCCLGIETTLTAKALTGFIGNAQSNPLRANLFDVEGVKLIVDYAHNVVAYRALCQMARSMHQGTARLLGVITAPGDRRSEDLFATGQVCGKGFDELVVYEYDPRGRHSGACIDEIIRGARSIAPQKPIQAQPNIRKALFQGLTAAKAGDVLVFTCAGTLEDLIEGIRLKNPAEALRIAREVSA